MCGLAERSETILIADRTAEAADALYRSAFADRVMILFASTSRDAIRLASQCHIDLMLVNLGLCDSEHGNLIAMLQDVSRGVPIIVIDDDGSAESERFAFAIGATWYLPKPLDHTLLFQVVESTLHRPAHAGSETTV